MKKLYLDIETTPILCETWSMYQEPIRMIKDWNIICFAYKWEGEKIGFHAVWDYSNNPKNDKQVTKELLKLLDEADVVIGHNMQKFDVRKINARVIAHGLNPSSPFQIIDTLKVARKYFNLTSNRLNDVAKHLGVEQKKEHAGFMELWDGIQAKDPKIRNTMKEYNIQDIVVTEQVYKELLPWIEDHPNYALIDGDFLSCPKCSSLNVKPRGYRYTRVSAFRRYRCDDCCGWSSERLADSTITKPKLK